MRIYGSFPLMGSFVCWMLLLREDLAKLVWVIRDSGVVKLRCCKCGWLADCGRTRTAFCAKLPSLLQYGLLLSRFEYNGKYALVTSHIMTS